MIHTKTKIIALVSLVLFILSCVLYAGFFYVITLQKARVHDERLRAAEADVQKQALRALEETIQTSADDRKKLKGYILADDSVIEFISLLESTAQEHGVVFTTENLETRPIDEMFETLVVKVKFSGSFESVLHMLALIETIPLQSNVEAVSFTRDGESDGWSAALTLGVTKYVGKKAV
jgi:hypothetical protein